MTLNIHNEKAFLSKPDAVIFDTDNTLYEYDPAHQKAMFAVNEKANKLLGIAPENFSKAYMEARDQVKKNLGNTASSHSRLLYFQRTLEILGLKTQLLMTLDLEQTYWRIFLGASKIFPGIQDFIQDLRAAGVRTAIVTDLTAQIQFRKIIYFGLDNYFDYVVTSEEAGADKPSKAPFEIALNKLQVTPEKCWMIGDSAVADIGGAKNLNITTLQKRHSGVVIASGRNTPDIVFDHFSELRALLHSKKWIPPVFDENHA